MKVDLDGDSFLPGPFNRDNADAFTVLKEAGFDVKEVEAV